MQSANPRRWSALAVIALAQFMVIMDTSIIGVALPEIQTDLGFTPESLSWVFNARAAISTPAESARVRHHGSGGSHSRRLRATALRFPYRQRRPGSRERPPDRLQPGVRRALLLLRHRRGALGRPG